MDPEIDELKGLVERQGKVIEETNRMMHSMRRSQRWGVFIRIAWWLFWVGAVGAAYYYYVQPYVMQIEKSVGNVQDFGAQFENFFAQFGHKTQ